MSNTYTNLETLVSSPPDDRDLVFVPKSSMLPPAIDLIPDVFEVENQGITNSCTANAACSLLEIAYKRAGVPKDFSRLFAYWYFRKQSGITGDNGAYPRVMGAALRAKGTCLEVTWPFKRELIPVVPDTKSHEEAKLLKVYEYRKLYPTPEQGTLLDQIKECIALGMPVLMTMHLHETFYSLSGAWKTNIWKADTASLGLHEVLIIGYDDASGRLLCQNSWGKYWGDGGFFGLPYDYIKRVTTEYWILSKLNVPYIPLIATDKPNLDTINSFCIANIQQPKIIADAAYKYNVSLKDLSLATGFTVEEVKGYFKDAEVTFWSIV